MASNPAIFNCANSKSEKNDSLVFVTSSLSAMTINSSTHSLEVKLFKWDDIPWKELAFPFIPEALMAYKNTKDKTDFQPVLIEGKSYIPKPPVPKPPGM